MLLFAALTPASTDAQLGDSSWITLYAPLSVRDAAECQDLQERFNTARTNISREHSECLQRSGGNARPAEGDICSQAACQGLHTDLYVNLPQREHDAMQSCFSSLHQFQAEQLRGRQRAESDAEHHASEAAADAAIKAERGNRRAANLIERQRQESAAGQARTYFQQIEIAKEVAEARERYEKAREFAANPFDTIVKSVGEKTQHIQDNTLAAANPFESKEKHDLTYDAISKAANKENARGITNPFAKAQSGKALMAVEQVHRQALGGLDDVPRQLADAGTLSASRYPSLPPAGFAHLGDNPFGTESVANLPSLGPALSYVRTRVDGPIETSRTDKITPQEIASGDHLTGSHLRCSADGDGIVLPACERLRRQKHKPN